VGAIVTLQDGLGACAVFTNLRSRKLEEKLEKPVELARLFAPSNYPHGKLSRFISGCIAWLRKNTNYITIVSYTDPNIGHKGIIYRASNFKLDGLSSKDGHPIIYLDGKSVSPRGLYDKHKTQSIPKLKEIYGERLQTKPKKQKLRFIYKLKQ